MLLCTLCCRARCPSLGAVLSLGGEAAVLDGPPVPDEEMEPRGWDTNTRERGICWTVAKRAQCGEAKQRVRGSARSPPPPSIGMWRKITNIAHHHSTSSGHSYQSLPIWTAAEKAVDEMARGARAGDGRCASAAASAGPAPSLLKSRSGQRGPEGGKIRLRSVTTGRFIGIYFESLNPNPLHCGRPKKNTLHFSVCKKDSMPVSLMAPKDMI